MNPISALLSRGKERASIAIESTPVHQEPEKESYPDRAVDVLRRFRKLAVEDNASRHLLEEEGNLARARLLEISAEGLTIFRKAAELSGKNWEGRLELNGSFREHAGFYSAHNEGVEVGENGVILFMETEEGTDTVTEKTSIRSKTNSDCTQISWIEFIRSKTFDGKEMTIERMQINFRGDALRKLSFIQLDGEAEGRGSFYQKPTGPLRELAIQFIP